MLAGPDTPYTKATVTDIHKMDVLSARSTVLPEHFLGTWCYPTALTGLWVHEERFPATNFIDKSAHDDHMPVD